MDVRNCVRCGKIFNYVSGQPICVNCKGQLEEKFSEVKQYLRENKGASIQEVSEANQVDIRQIRQWIREERITFAEDSMVGIECERCGVTIRTGRFCNNCKADLAGDLDSFNANQSGGNQSFKPTMPKLDDSDNRLRFRR